MNTQDIMNLTPGQLKKMPREELARSVSALASAANKRLRNFEKLNIETAATKTVKRTGGNFSVKGKSIPELIQEHKRATSFLQSKTGNLKKGAAKEQRARAQREKITKDRALTTRELIKADSRDIAKRSTEQLRKDLEHAAAVANKRINALGESGMKSKALTNALEGGGYYGVGENATREEIVAELARAKLFLDDKGSTVSGATRIHKNLEKRLDESLTQQDVKGLWKVYNKLMEKKPALVRRFTSGTVQKLIANQFATRKQASTQIGFNSKKARVFKHINELLDEMYKERQVARDDIARGNHTFSDVTNPFAEGDNIQAERNF